MRQRNRIQNLGLLVTLGVVATGCLNEMSGDQANPSSIEEFWTGLTGLCGNSYEGVLTQAVNPRFDGSRMVLHVFQCEPDRIAMSISNDIDNDGITRVHAFIRHPDGRLELRHTYRNEDGTSAEITDHGGFANNPGAPEAQIFPADTRTVDNQPSFWNWVWMIELHPAERYVYFIQRMGTESVARSEFDLSRPSHMPGS